MVWLIIVLLILVVILGTAFVRISNVGYRNGAGMFKNSEYNMDEKEELSDKEYYDENKGLFK